MNKVIVKNSKINGRGVFTLTPLRKSEIIEICDVIIIPKSQLANLRKTKLHDYYYCWDNRGAAIALGNGSLYNHSYNPNSEYIRKGQQLIFRTITQVRYGEEITVNYNGNSWDKRKVWFDK